MVPGCSLKEFFDSKPKQIHFNMIFVPVANRWRLFGISINPVVPKVAEAKPVTVLKIDEEPKPVTGDVDKKPVTEIAPQLGVPKQRPGG